MNSGLANGETRVKASTAPAGAPRQEETAVPCHLLQPTKLRFCPFVQLNPGAAPQFKPQELPVCKAELETHRLKTRFQALTFPEYELSP